MRNAVLKRHILYLTIFITTQLYIVTICFTFLSDTNYDPELDDSGEAWKVLFKLLFYC